MEGTDLFSDLGFGPIEDFIPAATSVVAPVMDPSPPLNGATTPPPATTNTNAPLCEVCGREIEWAGRGRRPKKCLDHRTRTRNPQRIVIQPSSDEEDAKRIQFIHDELLKGAGEFAGVIVHAAPVTSVTIAQQSPDAVAALIRIGEQYPPIMKGLEAVAKASPWMTIGKFTCAILLAISVDMGQMKPYGVAAEVLGVAAAAQAAGYRDPDEQAAVQQQQMMMVDRSMPPPPQFKGI